MKPAQEMSRASLASINPATGKISEVFDAYTEERIDAVLQGAVEARRAWSDLGVGRRASHLAALAEVLRKDRDRLARLATVEMGKPIIQAEAEVEKCAWTLDWIAENAASLMQSRPLESNATESYVQFQPLGVVLAVMPWNFPFWQFFRAAAPAVAGGNVAVLKHASNVPRCALAIEEACREAGLPDGVVSTLLVGSEAVSSLISDPRIAAVTLTGSDLAGSRVAEAAGKVLKKCVLELGGSDPFILLDDADVEEAARVGCRARNQNNGQSCIAAKRFIVLEAVADQFEQRLVDAVAALRVGDPMNRAVDVGPLARADLVDDLASQLQRSKAMGARLLTGGQRLEGPGNYFEPTVVANVTRDMPVFAEETFGPLAAVIRVNNEEEAITTTNDCQFGLGASVWTRDVERGKRLAKRVEAGMVFINGMVASDARLPFGGIKRSGYGRELSEFGIREFMNVQTVWIGPTR